MTDLTHALLLFPAGRAVAGLPLPPADGPVEVRRVSALPDPGALSAERPTVVFLDADLLGGTADETRRIGDAAQVHARKERVEIGRASCRERVYHPV